ncbi:hypothetical protein CMI45_00900 [Candidatus Pacearchaeota archaeon]|nr:hypothetical protein [Candidatus Pacearchaeota archaeon]
MEIEIPKIDFIVGTEKRFHDFVGSLNEKDKVAIVSHTDLDGIGAAKVANEVLNADVIKFVGYTDLTLDLVNELKEKKVSKIFVLDLYIKFPEFIKELEKIAEVCIIDHHQITEDWNSDRMVFLNSEGYCATYLCYYLFSKIQSLEKWDWLVVSACISDWMYFENQEWMKKVYEKYGEEFYGERKDDIKKSKFWDVQWDLSLAIVYFKSDLNNVFEKIEEGSWNGLGELEKHVLEVQNYINDSLERFEKEREEINGRILWEFEPRFEVGSILSTLLSVKYWTKTLLVSRNKEKTYNFSARRQDKKENMDLLLKKLTKGLEGGDGGGHVPAGGGHVRIEDKEEFLKRLKELPEEEIN